MSSVHEMAIKQNSVPVLLIVPLPLRDIAYNIVARFRHKIFKRPEVCSFRID